MDSWPHFRTTDRRWHTPPTWVEVAVTNSETSPWTHRVTLLVVGVTESLDSRTVNAPQNSIASVCQSSLGCTSVAPDAFVAKIARQGSGQLVVVNRTVTATEGVAFTKVVAAFSDTDSDAPDDYVATIDWADGSASQGLITGDGNGNFEISGSHTYERFGTYPLAVSLLDRDGSVVHPVQTGDDGNGLHRYQVSVDTTQLAGVSGFIRLQLNPAVSSRGSNAFAELMNFVSDGVLSGEPDLLGAAQGSLEGVVSLQNDSLLNQFTQAIQFGTAFTFDVLLGGEVALDANPHSLWNRFTLQVLDADVTTPLLTAHPSGAVLSIDINPDGSASAAAYPAADGEVVVSTTLTNDVVVTDAPFEAEDVAIQALEGEEFTQIVARFSDSNSLTTPADFTATVDWGDGSSSAADIVARGLGEFAVLGTHTYQKFGDYPLSVLIESLGGRSATAFGAASQVLDIQAARPTVVGSGSSALMTDINQDGRPDMVVAELFTSDQISVLLGRDDATFQPPLKVTAGLIPSAFTLADFNNDGRPDVVVGNTGDNKLHVLLSAEDQTFGDPLLAGQIGVRPHILRDR